MSKKAGEHHQKAKTIGMPQEAPSAQHHSHVCFPTGKLPTKTAVLSFMAGLHSYPRHPSGLPSTSSIRHGLTDCTGPPHSAQRSRAESCAMVSPIEIRGSQPIGLSRVTRHRGQWHAICVYPSAANSSMVACSGSISSVEPGPLPLEASEPFG